MRIISRSTLEKFWTKHPETKSTLEKWIEVVRLAKWKKADDVKKSFSKAKTITKERVRFEVSGGNYRMIVSFDFERQAAYIKFIGTHAEYDRIDAKTVSNY